jgi:DNA-binding PucR family transcriptional regulator
MELNELLKLYPNAIITSHPLSSQNYLQLALGQGWVNFPQSNLSTREKRLLKLLFKNKQINLSGNEFSNDPWAAYLMSPSTALPDSDQKLRIICFHVDLRKSDFQLTDWSDALAKMLPKNCLTNLSLGNNSGLLLEPFSISSPTLEEFDGIRQTLDSDFSTNSQLFVGHFWQSVPNLRQVLWLEKKLFQAEYPFLRGNTFALPQVFLHALSQQVFEPELAAAYRKQLATYPEIQAVIPTLYQQQGNLSSAAKQLYIHRNTLQYRLDKFYRETGLSLKKMDDLVFCYFLLIFDRHR